MELIPYLVYAQYLEKNTREELYVVVKKNTIPNIILIWVCYRRFHKKLRCIHLFHDMSYLSALYYQIHISSLCKRKHFIACYCNLIGQGSLFVLWSILVKRRKMYGLADFVKVDNFYFYSLFPQSPRFRYFPSHETLPNLQCICKLDFGKRFYETDCDYV